MLNKSNELNSKNKAMVKGKIQTLIEYGRIEIHTREELKEYPKGSLVSYLSKDDVFYLGGFLMSVGKKHFYIISDLADASNKIKISFKNINAIYVGTVFDTSNDVISIKENTKKPTKHPVKIGDIIVYYGKNRVDKNRFISTRKYQMMMAWYELFGKYYTDCDNSHSDDNNYDNDDNDDCENNIDK